jgi:hypothetical protein
MTDIIRLPGLRAETLVGFLSALGTLRVLERTTPSIRLSWLVFGGGWVAELHVPAGRFKDAEAVAVEVFTNLGDPKIRHPVLEWERFLGKSFSDERNFFEAAACSALEKQSSDASDFAPVFTSQLPVMRLDNAEHFDHPFRAARKDYYLGNLQSVVGNTTLGHIVKTLVRPWDYRDAMANQSLRLDHGDDRRHAYQWHAPTQDPARHKSGCMLGANRLAIESFPLYPCVVASGVPTAVGFDCKSRSQTWITWPVWTPPCSLAVVSSLLNLSFLQESSPPRYILRSMGIVAVLRSRRLPIEKNKVFLPPETL